VVEELRHYPPSSIGTLQAAHQFLDQWRSRIPALVKRSKSVRTHREGILAAVELGPSNSEAEGAELEDPCAIQIPVTTRGFDARICLTIGHGSSEAG